MRLLPLSPTHAEHLAALWNLALGDRFPMRHALLRRNLWGDLNLLPDCSFVAEADGQIVGFVAAKLNREFIGKLVPRLAQITSLVVHPDWQRQGIGTALLDRALQELRRYQPARVSLGRDTFHFFPGLPDDGPEAMAFFRKRGARIGAEPATDLVGDLRSYELPAAVQETLSREPVEIRPCRPDETGLLAEHLRLAFPGRWQYEYHKFLYDGGDPADYIIVREGDRVIGFCHIYTPESAWIGPNVYWAPIFPEDRFGGAGPLGVAEEARGRGLGLAVVAYGIAELKRRGCTRAGIDWTTLVEFYGKLGFVPWKQFYMAEIDLQAD